MTFWWCMAAQQCDSKLGSFKTMGIYHHTVSVDQESGFTWASASQAATKVSGGAASPSSHGSWQDSGWGGLLDGGPPFPDGCGQKPPIVPYYVGLPGGAVFFSQTSKGASPSKVSVRTLWNTITEVAAYHLGNHLLARTKPQILLSFRERGLHKDMDTKRLGSFVSICHRQSIKIPFKKWEIQMLWGKQLFWPKEGINFFYSSNE